MMAATANKTVSKGEYKDLPPAEKLTILRGSLSRHFNRREFLNEMIKLKRERVEEIRNMTESGKVGMMKGAEEDLRVYEKLGREIDGDIQNNLEAQKRIGEEIKKPQN